MTPSEIRQRRLAYPLTVAELAKRVGCSAQAIRQWEYGHRTPKPAFLRMLRAAFAATPPPLDECGGRTGGCACTCHGRRVVAWSAEEEAALRDGIERGDSPAMVAQELTQTFGHLRTTNAVKVRAARRGISRLTRNASQHELRRRLGVSTRRVRGWITSGRLPASRDWRANERQDHWWRITPDDLDAFVDRYAGILFQPSQVRDRVLRARAEAAVNRRQTA